MANIKQYIFFSLILYFQLVSAFNLDSLKKDASNQQIDTLRIISNIKLTKYYLSNNKPDSSNFYLIETKAIADKSLSKSRKDTNTLLFLINVYKALGRGFYRQELYDLAYQSYIKRLEIANLLDINYEKSSVYNLIGNIFKFKSDFNKALSFYQKSDSIAKKINDKRKSSIAKIGIANVYINWKDYVNAVNYYNRSFDLAKQIDDKDLMAAALVGIGNVYSAEQNYQKAVESYQKSLEYTDKNNKDEYALGLLSIADVFLANGKYNLALKYYNEALGMVRGNMKIRESLVLNRIGELYLRKQNLKMAEEYFKKSAKVAQQVDYKKVELQNYKSLSELYSQNKDYKNAYKYHLLYSGLKDSIFNQEKFKEIALLQTKYETKEKEQEIAHQQAIIEKEQAENKAKQLKIKSQQRLIIFAITGLVLLIVIAIVILRFYRQKQKANKLLSQQKRLIEEANEELNNQAEKLKVLNKNLNLQNEEIRSQRDEIQLQKEQIEEIHHEISQSIDYATKIQKSILPDENILNQYLAEHFIFFRPKDKVSGDFYWWAHVENHTIITVADCTGHGVPGAFMSMLGASFLREIVEKEYITHTGVILRKLRKEIIKTLKQKGEQGEQKDGMDMAIISINHETNVMQFSGANNPLYIIKDKELQINEESANAIKLFDNLKLTTQNSKLLYEIKPDKMPIAIYERMNNFTTHEIQLEKGDQLYLFSDGYADQFGGEKGKKFKYKPFKRLLLENSGKPMAEQKEALKESFEKWKAHYEQIDDITVLGLKV